MAKRRSRAGRRGRELLERVLEGQADLLKLAESSGFELEELAAWAGDPEVRRKLEGLRLLSDMQAQMILSRYRAAAAARLIALGSQEEDPELARKACVELLKLHVVERLGESAETGAARPEAAVDEARVLAALERMGGAHEG